MRNADLPQYSLAARGFQGDCSHLTLLAAFADQTPRPFDDSLSAGLKASSSRILQGNNLKTKQNVKETEESGNQHISLCAQAGTAQVPMQNDQLVCFRKQEKFLVMVKNP